MQRYSPAIHIHFLAPYFGVIPLGLNRLRTVAGVMSRVFSLRYLHRLQRRINDGLPSGRYRGSILSHPPRHLTVSLIWITSFLKLSKGVEPSIVRAMFPAILGRGSCRRRMPVRTLRVTVHAHSVDGLFADNNVCFFVSLDAWNAVLIA